MSKEKMVATAKRCKDLLLKEEFELDFSKFSGIGGSNIVSMKDKSLHACGTSFCLAGALAHKDGYPDEYICDVYGFHYGAYSSELIGFYISGDDDEWDFIFGSGWCEDRDLAIKRMDYILDNNGDIPSRGDWFWYGWVEDEEQ